ncbi:12864_t:CDS:2, partial [Entrophospora sp. SA101]
HQVLEEMLEKNEHASSMFESVSNSWKKTDESVLAYNRNNSNNNLEPYKNQFGYGILGRFTKNFHINNIY